MKTIGFIGAFDKIDIILNVAKISAVAEQKVLIIDATILQKARYIVPVLNPTKSYITTFEEIDVAVGFEKIEDIKKYLSLSNNESFDYDFIFVDCDNADKFKSFGLKEANINYFVTNYGLYSLKRGLEIIQEVGDRIPVKKVWFSNNMSDEEDSYLNILAKDMNIDWIKDKLYFPFEEGDLNANLENQVSEKINLRELSESYKEGMIYMCEEILKGKKDISYIRKIVKNLERG